MAIFRNVHVTFWTDAKVVDDFTPEDKYFYVYLLTNPHTNLCGCYEVSLKQMSDELGYNKDTVERLIQRFHEVHKILAYNKETKEMLLYNWNKYNWTKSPKFQAALVKEIPKVKCPEFLDYLNGILSGDTVSIPYPYGMDTTDTVTDTDTVSVSDTNKPRKNQKHKYGEYNNVLLTDEELDKLKEEYPDWQERIERLSSYVASTGKSYKSHYATIRNWARKDGQTAPQKQGGRKEMVPAWMNKDREQAFDDRLKKDMDALKKFMDEQEKPELSPEYKARADALRQSFQVR